MSTPAGSSRCAAHPGRPAVDLCPLCARPRCGADVLGGSCAVCGGGPATDPRPTELFTYLSPAVLRALCGGAAQAAARHPGRSPIGSRVRVVAVGYAVIGMALGFLLEGTYAPVSLKLDVLVAYVIAAGAAWLWTAPGRSVAAPEGSSGWL